MKWMPPFLSLLAVAALGCGSLVNLNLGQSLNLYNLTPNSERRPEIEPVSWQLVVEEPLAAGGLEGNRIAVRPSPTQLKYLSGARWTVRIPKMVQTVLVESLESSGGIVAVGRQAIGLSSDYNLKTELRSFQAEYFEDEKVPKVRVRLNAKLLKQPRLQIIASESFEVTIRANGGSVPAIVEAFDAALGQVVYRLVEWTLTTPAKVESQAGDETAGRE